mmetsp:Transcript_25741/g.50173  ORF Transcript_25741/g.50173 Transcript_25741/m.50173 type:complete len:91 (+) Transcript_25741:851-1123(+)
MLLKKNKANFINNSCIVYKCAIPLKKEDILIKSKELNNKIEKLMDLRFFKKYIDVLHCNIDNFNVMKFIGLIKCPLSIVKKTKLSLKSSK